MTDPGSPSNHETARYPCAGDADTKSEPPYDSRARVFKEQFALADQLKMQLESKNSENYELKKMVRIIQSYNSRNYWNPLLLIMGRSYKKIYLF